VAGWTHEAKSHVLVPKYAEAAPAGGHGIEGFHVAGGDEHPVAADEFEGVVADVLGAKFGECAHEKSPEKSLTTKYTKYTKEERGRDGTKDNEGNEERGNDEELTRESREWTRI
jgi:hypothetical protein